MDVNNFKYFICCVIICYSVICSSGQNTETVSSNDTTTDVSRNLTRNNRISRMHQRQRDYRLQMIRDQVLIYMGWNSVPNITNRDELLRQYRQNITSFTFTSGNCYSAYCRLPHWINYTMWNDSSSQSFRVRFDVFPDEDRSVRSILNATLKLHLQARRLCNCEADLETQRIYVKVLQYLKPLRRPRPRGNRGSTRRSRTLRVRQKILSTKMINWSGNTWVSFPVKPALHDWIIRGKRNHGFEIMVYNQFDQKINASTVFSPIDCGLPPDFDCDSTSAIFLRDMMTSPVLEVFKSESPGSRIRSRRETKEKTLSPSTNQHHTKESPSPSAN